MDDLDLATASHPAPNAERASNADPARDADTLAGLDPDETRGAVRRQLVLLAVFAVFVLLLFAFAGATLASGGGCGGG